MFGGINEFFYNRFNNIKSKLYSSRLDERIVSTYIPSRSILLLIPVWVGGEKSGILYYPSSFLFPSSRFNPGSKEIGSSFRSFFSINLLVVIMTSGVFS